MASSRSAISVRRPSSCGFAFQQLRELLGQSGGPQPIELLVEPIDLVLERGAGARGLAQRQGRSDLVGEIGEQSFERGDIRGGLEIPWSMRCASD